MKERFAKFGNKTKMIAGALALAALMAVNVQVGMNDGSTTDVSLLGLEASVFAPTAVATLTYCGRCDFDSYGGLYNDSGENIGFCNYTIPYVYIGCTENDGSQCEDTYQWGCML
jgi:hypothetical protein